MATPRKPTTKKPAVKKTAAKAKPTAKKPAAKATARKSSASSHRLFAINIVPDSQPFMTFRMTTQTVYWLIFAVTILAMGLWVLRLNLQIISLYDQIDQNNIAESQAAPITHKTIKK